MDSTLVRTKNGMISGLQKDGCRAYFGIKYAKAPTGNLRFKAPEEVEPWEGVYKADTFPGRCYQDESSGFYAKEFYSDPDFNAKNAEDCLALNLWVPEGAKAGETKCPVAFYIHGGAFMHGWSSELEFDGEEYARHDVILVTINYRLGIFGFLAHPWLSRESERGVSGNYGILDQIAALKWVKDNIACFGGDPDNVMVFGQSAGAMSTQTLCSSPLTDGLITKAVLQSGGSYGKGLHSDITLKEAEAIGQEITDTMGVKSLDELRAMTDEELFNGFNAYMEKKMAEAGGDFTRLRLTMIPVIDGYVLKKGYYETMDAGEIKDIPYMLGSTGDDIGVTDEDKAAGRGGMLYEGTKLFSFKEEQVHSNPAYVYFFARKMPGDDAGAFHSSELWYVFGTLGRCWRQLDGHDRELSGRMLDCWTNFCKYSDPNGDKNGASYAEKWRKCTSADPYVELFK